MKTLVNIDFDGVLIPNYFEKHLVEKLSDEQLPEKISQFDSKLFNWYTNMINSSPLAPLNIPLLRFFENNMDKYVLRLWTNRSKDIMKRTIENLDGFKYIFDSFLFYSGDKLNSRVEGIVIDNAPKYLKCGEFGLYYEWKGGDNSGNPCNSQRGW
jgi:hypothetical protein